MFSCITDHHDGSAATPFKLRSGTAVATLVSENVPDEELLSRISRHDQNALELLYDRYARLLFGLCIAIVNKQEDAEDVLQEAFLRIWEKAAAFNGSKGSAYTWIVTLTRNRAIDRLRSKNFRQGRQKQPDIDFEMMIDDSVLTPLDNTSFAERAALVKEAFAKLPGAQRQVLEMAYFQGCSQSEISSELNVPLGTVKTRTREGLKKLNRILRERLR